MKRILATATTDLFLIRYPFRIRESKAVCSFDVKCGSHKKPISRKTIVLVYGLKTVYTTTVQKTSSPLHYASLVIISFLFTLISQFPYGRTGDPQTQSMFLPWKRMHQGDSYVILLLFIRK